MSKNSETPDGFGQRLPGAREIEAAAQEIAMDAIMNVFGEMLPALRAIPFRIDCSDEVRTAIATEIEIVIAETGRKATAKGEEVEKWQK